MRRIDTEELKQVQLEILDVAIKFCDEHEIKYWLDAGTLLGAIRHKGYIPWDDDIDIGMLRPDYDKFIKLFNEHNTRYTFHCIENDPDFALPFGKLFDNETVLYEPDEKGIKFAVNIDIWVYDNAPDDDAIVEDMFMKRDSYRRKWYMRQMRILGPSKGSLLRRLCAYGYRTAKKIIRFPLYCLPANYYSRKIMENSKRYVHEKTKRVGNFMGWAKFTCNKQAVKDSIYVEFEGKKYKAPAGYDEWLRSMYGNYMELPPVEERVTHHTFMAFKED